MLKAVLHGKAGRIEFHGDENYVSWRELFKSREDLLTSAIFTRWSYLSYNVQSHLMCKWLGIEIGGDFDFSTYQGIEFWPKFDLFKIEGRKFVEPDILIKFDEFNVLIEVKPPLGGDQGLRQWQDEITGYFSWEGREDKPLLFLAIGRIDKVPDDWRREIMGVGHIHKPIILNALNWKVVAESIFNLIQSIKSVDQDNRILEDMLSALELYGVRGHDYKWSDYFYKKNTLPNISLHLITKLYNGNDIGKLIPKKFSYDYEFANIVDADTILNMELLNKWKC